MIVVNGKTVGSSLIGQAFSEPKYFWGRPSAAGVTAANPAGYDANSSARVEPGPDEQGPHRPGHGARSTPLRAGQRRRARPRRPRDDLGLRPRPGHQPGRGRVPGGPRRHGPRHDRRTHVRAIVARHTDAAAARASSASRGSTCCELNLDLDGLLQMSERERGWTRSARPARARCWPGCGRAEAAGRGRLRVYLGMAPGRGQDLPDARGGPPAARSRNRRRRRLRRAARPAQHRGAARRASRSCRGAGSSTAASSSRRWTRTRSSRAIPRSPSSTSSPTPTCPGSPSREALAGRRA